MPKPIIASVPGACSHDRVLGAGHQKNAFMNGSIGVITGLGALILAGATISCFKAGVFSCATGVGVPLGIALIVLSAGLGLSTFAVGGSSVYFLKRAVEQLS